MSKQSAKIEKQTKEHEDMIEDDDAEQIDDAEQEDEIDNDGDDDIDTSKKLIKHETAEEILSKLTELDVEIDKLVKQFNEFTKRRKQLFNQFCKENKKELKKNKKRKSKNNDNTKEATGFVKAIPVPKKFADFYNKHLASNDEIKKTFESFEPNGSAPRTEITKMIYAYIRSNELYGKKEDGTLNKREIVPDENLRILFGANKNDIIGFSNFQSYITRLYGSSSVVESSGEEEVSEVEVSKSKTSNKAKVAIN